MSNKTVGPLEALGVAIIVMGIFTVLAPGASSTVAAIDFVASDTLSVLTGTIWTVGVLTIFAGLAVLFVPRESGE